MTTFILQGLPGINNSHHKSDFDSLFENNPTSILPIHNQENFKSKWIETNIINYNTSSTNTHGRVKAAIVALVRNSELFGMQQTIREITDRFNKNYNYPIILLNDEPFTEEFKQGIEPLTTAKVLYGLVDGEQWGYPSWINKRRAKKEMNKATYKYAKSESYRFMCRFQAGYIFRHSLLKELDYYWRVEPNVHYFCDINYDPFKYMQDNKLIYGFTIAVPEIQQTIRSLWTTTLKFIKINPYYISPNNTLKWILTKKKKYNGCHYWSNFEIVNLGFYRSKAYMDYFNFLDRSGGFFYERWGDAPIHTLAVSMFLNKSQIHYFEDIGYKHQGAGHCPVPDKRIGACVCDENKNKANSHTCGLLWKKM
ncbi:hypothetical protein BB559_003952 [Furculomyces boomerangus]|uniref:Glycosyltransferase family 15 protein n=2 Tax=Harpellales TaxID=61421 RepID=A0A2T9YHP4_9FUNG|nr:hypothetical protein BB559_003952 [Furculomyces boomerangus]PVZ98630.1 hypothetical protein BB558_005366 [Smittium angustum]